ncbi:TMV resistance protein N-like [Cucurbita moschata]|uniref:TMV resistance protein N-like n=1 Tax=Cucurbita moschata TaxID=3662 RepID=A0A6J1EI05_CUCMO|nr:TMV resistance protein N-like [Cucurbita moschata]
MVSSRWCLEELSKIFECHDRVGMTVLPIFYRVDPSDVRNQTGTFAEAFAKHQHRFGEHNPNIQKWRHLLTKLANLRAWPSEPWTHESEVIEEITTLLWKRIKPTLKVTKEDQLVGINSKLTKLSSVLNPNSYEDVIWVGIHGMGGIGKTTIARVCYERIRDEFEAHCFVSDDQEKFETSGLPCLQSELLSRIFSIKNDILDVDEGIVMIHQAILRKKILLVLDNENCSDQIMGLIPNKDSFGDGNRIIITTRNIDLLSNEFEVKRIFEMEELTDEEALQLLNLSACPKQDCLKLSKDIVREASVESILFKSRRNAVEFPILLSRMHQLRLLNFQNVRLKNELEYCIPKLEGCTSLVNIHPTIFTAKKLTFLSLKDCINLTHFPTKINIKALQVLILSGCSKLKKIPEFSGNTNILLELYLDGTSISSLPSSIASLDHLTVLSLTNCKNLINISNALDKMTSLKSLNLSGCSKLGNRKRKWGDTETAELDVRQTVQRTDDGDNIFRNIFLWLCKAPTSGIFGIPSLAGLYSLTSLNLSDCKLEEVPEGIECLVSLVNLNLSLNNFSRLPTSISRLHNLKRLNVNECEKLLHFSELPPRILRLMSNGCISLKDFLDTSKVNHSYFMVEVNLLNCYKLANNKGFYKMINSWMRKTFLLEGTFDIDKNGIFDMHQVGS